MPKTVKVDVSSFLKLKHRPTGGSQIPSLSDYGQEADRVVVAYKAFKSAEAGYRAVESELLSDVDSDYSKNGSNGHFSKSFNIQGDKTDGVQVTYQDRFSPIPIDNAVVLKEACGDSFSTLFIEKRDRQ